MQSLRTTGGSRLGTAGTAAAILALTCGWVVACHDDDASGPPPKAPTVPNTPLVPLPIPGVQPEADPYPETPVSALTVGLEIDPTVSADEWTIRITTLDDTADDLHVTFTEHQGELSLQRYTDITGVFRVEVYGKTTLSDGSEYIIGHRVVTTHFVPNEHRLVYLFVDQQCAYSGGSSADGGSGCANEHEWCYEGKCRAEELAANDLPLYRDDWKEHPPSPCASDVPAVKLGEGFLTYAERNDGDTVTIECGSQGGHHIWVAARAQGLDQRSPVVTITAPASDAGAPLITSYPVTRLYAAADAGDAGASTSCEATGIQFQLDPDGRPVQGYLGKPLDITLMIKDHDGKTAAVTRHVQVGPKLSTTSCF